MGNDFGISFRCQSHFIENYLVFFRLLSRAFYTTQQLHERIEEKKKTSSRRNEPIFLMLQKVNNTVVEHGSDFIVKIIEFTNNYLLHFSFSQKQSTIYTRQRAKTRSKIWNPSHISALGKLIKQMSHRLTSLILML